MANEDLSMEEFLDLQNEAIQKYPYKFTTCFHDQGYVRQPLFYCMDCRKGELGGVICYSCSISCHADHQIVELGHRRNVRCECGNEACFPEKCTLSPQRSLKGTDPNNYSSVLPKAMHNFLAKFCYCNRQFDELEQEPESFMLQCRLCEDWFHSHCLRIAFPVPEEDKFEEFFCGNCVSGSKFLSTFYHRMMHTGETAEALCFLPQLSNDAPTIDCELFCNSNWKSHLCKCSSACIEALEADPIATILIHPEPEWTPETEVIPQAVDYENALNSLNQMDRTVALDGISACKEFSHSLKAFLQPFAESGKVVTKEDTHEFFANKMSRN